MMARAYRLYSGEVHDDMEPLAYTDKADIADNAKADVQLMTHLGVMTDVGDGRFDPEGPYSVEDSLVGLYRLYQNTCVGKKPDQPDIFALTPRQKQIAQAYSSGPYIHIRQKMTRPLPLPTMEILDTWPPLLFIFG